MPIIRNPFRKQDENVRPATAVNGVEQKTPGVLAAKPIDIREKEQAEYKLSEINDSGVYLPPSPPERKPFWSTHSSRSTTSSTNNHRSLLNENEPFNISRESFDSYRRSFDISARSPVINGIAHDSSRPPRASLDSRTFQPPLSRTSNSFHRPLQVPAQTKEETDTFEDVDIGTEAAVKAQPTKKRGLFSRITDSGDHHSGERPASGGASTSGGGSSWHHFGVGGRKRGQSTGQEMGSLVAKSDAAPKLEGQGRKEQLATSQQQAPKAQGVATSAQTDLPATKSDPAPGSVKPDVQQAVAGAEVQKIEDGMKKLNPAAPPAASDTNGEEAKEERTSQTPEPASKDANAQAPVDQADRKVVDS